MEGSTQIRLILALMAGSAFDLSFYMLCLWLGHKFDSHWWFMHGWLCSIGCLIGVWIIFKIFKVM
jgi:hypothetical protein